LLGGNSFLMNIVSIAQSPSLISCFPLTEQQDMWRCVSPSSLGSI
jgi:hypothetical protein